MKSYFSSKTMWFGFGVTVMGGLMVIAEGAPLPEPWGGVITSLIGAGIIVLRKLTTQAVGTNTVEPKP